MAASPTRHIIFIFCSGVIFHNETGIYVWREFAVWGNRLDNWVVLATKASN